MPHPFPSTNLGSSFNPEFTFAETYEFVGKSGVLFLSTTDEKIKATRGTTKDGMTKTIVFNGEHNRHGATCETCWGYGTACDKSWIGQCAKALDRFISSSRLF
jgi:hypothetical protein